MLRKILSLVLSFSLLFQYSGFAQTINLADYLAVGTAQGAVPADRFRPASLRYFSYEPGSDNFQILLDKADEKGLSDIQVKDKADELMRYFRIGLSLPNDKFWVNLRPDAPEQIIDPELERTDIGKIMLEADLQLKKDTSSLTSPQTREGKVYWDKLYKKAGELFGSENITIPTITRPWIVPGEIIVRQSGNSAYIYKAALKVLLEEDYLTSRGGSRTAPTYQQYAFSDPRLKELNEYSTQLIRELIIPHLTKEVNRAKRYAGLRQVYYSLILARWFKGKFQGLSPKGTVPDLIDSGNLTNLISREPWSKDTYYQGYKKSFEQGEYNLSETVHTPTGQLIRRYISGGIYDFAGEPTGNYKNTVNSSIVKPENSKLINYTSGSEPVVRAAASAVTLEGEKKSVIENITKANIENSAKYIKLIRKAENFEQIYNVIMDFRLENLSKQSENWKVMKWIVEEQERLEPCIAADEFKDSGITAGWIREQMTKRLIAVGKQTKLNQPVTDYISFNVSGGNFKGSRDMEMNIYENRGGLIKDSGTYAYGIIVSQNKSANRWLPSNYKTYLTINFFPDDDVEVTSMPRDLFLHSGERLHNVKQLIKSIKGALSSGSASSAVNSKQTENEQLVSAIIYIAERFSSLAIFSDIILHANGTMKGLKVSSLSKDTNSRLKLDEIRKSISEYKNQDSWSIEFKKGSTLKQIKNKLLEEAGITASSAITNEELKKRLEEMNSSREQLSGAIIVEQEEFKQEMVIWLKEMTAAAESKSRIDMLSQAQRDIIALGVAIARYRGLLQELIKQDIDLSKNNQGTDMIAKLINTFQDREERMLEEREGMYSKFPYTGFLTSDDKEEISNILLKIKGKSQEYYKSLRKTYASSALTALPLGGIDFRQMNMLIQPMGSFRGLDFSPTALSSSALEAMDLERDLEGINQMTLGRRRPHPQRLKEYVSACIFKGKIDEKADDFILSMLEVFQLQAEEGIESASQDREAVVLADTRGYALPEKRLAASNSYSLN